MRAAIRFATLICLAVSTPLMAQESPVVVELYTSQGCSSCPPADEILKRLTKRDDVLPLALHVDYWDYIGWADKFADVDVPEPLPITEAEEWLGDAAREFHSNMMGKTQDKETWQAYFKTRFPDVPVEDFAKTLGTNDSVMAFLCTGTACRSARYRSRCPGRRRRRRG